MKKLEDTVFAIVGLGLIGGSYAKALRNRKAKRIIGMNRNHIVSLMAKDEGYITDIADDNPELLREADIIICAQYPGVFVSFVRDHVKYFKKDVVLTDAMGIKGDMPDQIDALLGPDMDFIPAHPMAGREGRGYGQSSSRIFEGANFIIIKRPHNKRENVEWIRDIALEIGCGRVVELTAQEHDGIIAYTSDLPHIMAVSLINSESMTPKTKYFVAGSFRDATRVADINADLWTDLFLLNKKPVLSEIERLEAQLQKWKKALQTEDRKTLHEMMDSAKMRRRDMFYGKH
jgi:prephenate dehydrogenase